MLFQNNVMYFTLCENTLPHYFSMFSLCLFFSYFLSIQHNQKKMPDDNIEHWDNLEDLFDTSKIQDIQHQDYITIYFLYIDKDDDIIKISKHNHHINNTKTDINSKTDAPCFFDKDSIIKIIQRHTLTRNGSKYLFDKLLLYHIPLEKEDIKNIHLDENWKNHFNDNLFEVNIYKDCTLPKSLSLFHDINSFFVFYKEKCVLKSALKKSGGSKHTKRVRFNQHNYTKKKL